MTTAQRLSMQYRRAEGEITVATKNADFVLEFKCSAERTSADIATGQQAGWSFDDCEPTAYRRIGRDGQDIVRDVRRGTLLYDLLCGVIDRTDFHELCHAAQVCGE